MCEGDDVTGGNVDKQFRQTGLRLAAALFFWLILAAMLSLLVESASGAGLIERISVNPAGEQGNQYSHNPNISPDGRYVAFRSMADNLVPGDYNMVRDIFVKDTATGSIVIATSDAAGVLGNGMSSKPSLSATGRYVAFYTFSSNLVPGDTNYYCDVFRKDLQTGEIKRLSVANDGSQGYGNSYDPSISADGRYVVFYSEASELVPGDDNQAQDVFLSDAETGTITVLSTKMSGRVAGYDSAWPSISADGAKVAFHSAGDDLASGDDNGKPDVFVRDINSGKITMVSVGAGGELGNSGSRWAAISGNGRYIAFESTATNLVPGDNNGHLDIFVKDTKKGVLELVSVSASGVQGNGDSRFSSLSADGRYVVFQSYADNLVPGDDNGQIDIFVKDRKTGAVTLASVNASGDQGVWSSVYPTISADGHKVAFQSGATNLVAGDTNGVQDIFLTSISTSTSNGKCKGGPKRCR